MSVYAKFAWSDYVLDILLIGWFVFAFVVAGCFHLYVFTFGPIRGFATEKTRSRDGGGGGGSVAVHTGMGETILWLNATVNWLYLHHHKVPEFISFWIQSLNEQATKLGGAVQVKFEDLQSNTLPPKLSDIYSEPGPKDTFIVRAFAESRDLSFKIFASQQTVETLKLTNCVANIQKLRGGIKLKFTEANNNIGVAVSFDGRPDVKVAITPVSIHQDPADLCDLGIVEELVKNCICLASTNLSFSQLQGCPPVSPLHRFSPLESPVTSATMEPLVRASKDHSTTMTAHLSALSPPKLKRVLGEYKLLVKIIKANTLGGKGYGAADVYCFLSVDSPVQRYTTSIAKNTTNPFWDEHYLFEINKSTFTLSVTIYNAARKPDEYIGRCVMYMDELKKIPSSRQILPVQREDKPLDFICGYLTAEFLLMEPADAEHYLDPSLLRACERNVAQARSRGGADGSHPHNFQLGTATRSAFNSSTHSQALSTADSSLSASSEIITVGNNSSVPETAIRVLMDDNRRARTPTKTSTLTITSIKRAVHLIDEPKEMEDENCIMVNNSPNSLPAEKEKKKRSFSARIRKRFSRSKKRSQSADRVSSHPANQLLPPEQKYGSKSTDDIERDRSAPATPNLKKSRSLGGSLRKLFTRRSRSRTRGDSSRESSLSRDTPRQDDLPLPSRDSSLKRATQSDRSSFV